MYATHISAIYEIFTLWSCHAPLFYHTNIMWLLFAISPHVCLDCMHGPHMTESGSIRSVALIDIVHACLSEKSHTLIGDRTVV